MFTHQHLIQLHETDAYGIIFFANQLKFCHDTFQALLTALGFPLPPSRQEADWLLVIVHAESDYLVPLHVGDLLTITVVTNIIGTTSLVMNYTLTNQHGVHVGNGKTVHVCIHAASSAKIPLPDTVRQAFSGHLT